jgi:CPA2 family monovalent cation:H+ antiporter-2
MFGVGLHVRIEELLAVRKTVLPGALVGLIAGVGAGFAIGRIAGWGNAASAVFGLAIAVTSTVVLLRVMTERGTLDTPAGRVAVGWLVVEDLLAVLLLVVVPMLAHPVGAGFAASVGIAFVKVAALLVFTLIAGSKIIPWVLARIARTASRELFTLAVLVTALGLAVGASRVFGASMALGAFLAGLVVGRSRFAARAASDAIPMRDAFAVLFFVSVGMMLDPRQLVANAGLVALTVVAIVVVKPLVEIFVLRWLGQLPRTAVVVGLSLGQIGEFSFIVAALGRDLHLLAPRATQTIVAASMITITLSPLISRLAKPIAAAIPVALGAREPPAGEVGRALVVGYGPVGQTVVRLLREASIELTVIEMNHDTVVALERAGFDAIHGDAARREVLEHAGIEGARALVFAASGAHVDEVVRVAKELNPALVILARTSYVREAGPTRTAGADIVIVGEVEVARAMTEHLLNALEPAAS